MVAVGVFLLQCLVRHLSLLTGDEVQLDTYSIESILTTVAARTHMSAGVNNFIASTRSVWTCTLDGITASLTKFAERLRGSFGRSFPVNLTGHR
jgi:hypothetical protein